MAPVKIIDAEGNAALSASTWFPEYEEMGPEALTIVSVLGAQASGKSTLLNKLFGTSFEIGSRSAVATATTKGVFADKAKGFDTVVAVDVEGSDSRERGREGRAFQARCAAFVTCISDVLLLNLWYHDVGRFDATSYGLLKAVFSEAAKNAGQDALRTALVFVVRDVDDDVVPSELEHLLQEDAKEIFDDVTKGEDISSMFDISVVALPHMRHREEAFTEACQNLANRILQQDAPESLAKTQFSKVIPADGIGTFTSKLWDERAASKAVTTGVTANGDEGGDGNVASLTKAFKCNEAFSQALTDATLKLNEFQESTLEGGEKIEDYGAKAAQIMTEALASYDVATEECHDDSIQTRKRRELESIIDTSQHAIYMKQLQVLRENALAHFKSGTASDDMPSDFAFYTADSQFQREAEESKRPGSSWSANQERQDLQNMMQEISTQRKRLLTSQVTAAQQQAHAMQYLQMQQSQINQIQAQAYGGSTGQWNVGAAYRPPDTNINASLSYQQGRTNIQISMVPDESASLLGPNGFTAGVGPGNLGLSFNIGL
ncbi:Protein SEY1 [Gracilariopsis chorda]|uniref:Protein SEY1 n=1 Tax=Gracilariopsis chorda TaxID=448386 RepID=A0A2V3J6G9_9FLOR|nr:Protein SEY1 [Gracilariopsis chorda]|eukprot:PXF50021.1 Protein SEY1 [Gracilariopsis chorda]